jgi:hypothetical protein
VLCEAYFRGDLEGVLGLGISVSVFSRRLYFFL